MSISSLSSGVPADATLEQALRVAVRQVYKSKNLVNLTVKRIRKSVEEDLDLQDDFFKNDPAWKEKSKTVIQSEVDAHTEANASSQQTPSSPPTKKQSRPTPPPKAQKQHPKLQGKNRASTEDGGPKKRRKKVASDDEGAASDKAGSRSKKPIPRAKKRSPSSSMSPPPKEEEEREEAPSGLNGTSEDNGTNGEHSKSEMSEVFDEPPKVKGRGRKSGSAKPSTKKPVVSKAKKPSEQPADPDAEEIKRLQGWLVKCGIRKVWGKELAPYDTPKAKIRHLKEMLTEAGMTGRYSAEKEGNKHWGKTTSEEEDGGIGKPRRRLARGLEGLDFLNDDDGEETD
ncbi:hypothetical protein ABVK25_002030 [Lepraria finkii]|uniref:Uncharacterized protein n=1 Tax=Lepraria finkii TaxID=1340010 RepID=A0ABR4BLC7_9LECA